MQKGRGRGLLFLLLSLVALCAGCYRMPSDDEYSVIPSTNNPAVIGRDHGNDGLIPGSAF